MEPNQLIKRYTFSTSVWVFTIINTTVFLVSRNSFWISHPGQAWLASGRTEDRTYLASEFQRNLSCYAPWTCLRSGGAFLSQALIEVITFISEATLINLTIDQKTFIILIGGLAWRLLCLGIFVFAITKLFHNFNVGLLLGNSLTFLLSGLPLWQLGRLLVNLPLDLSPLMIDRANAAFVHMSFMNLSFYDYGFFALVPITILILSRIKDLHNVSSWIFFFTGLWVGSFYEVFVPICLLSLILYSIFRKEKISFKIFWLLGGQFVWTLGRAFTLKFTEVANPQSEFFIGGSIDSFLKLSPLEMNKGISTTSSLPSIALQLVLISFLAIAVGFFAGQVTKKILNIEVIDNLTFQSINAVTLAVTILIVGSFLRPIYVETGRQSLGLSITLVIFAFTYTQRFSKSNFLGYQRKNKGKTRDLI